MPSLLTVVRMGGLRLALNAFLDAHDVVRMWRTARPFRQLLRVLHLRVGHVPIRGETTLGVRRWLRTREPRELIDAGLRTLELVDCDLRAEQLDVLCAAARARGVLEKLDIRDNSLCAEGGAILAEALADNKVLTELNFSGNKLAEDEDGETDMSGVIAISDAIPTMGALTRLDMSYNDILGDGGKVLFEALQGNHVVKEINVASNNLSYNARGDSDLSSVIAICDAISSIGALTSLNLAGNYLRAEGAKHVAEAIKVNVSVLRFDWYRTAVSPI
jgi:hypothetical protein